MRLGGIQDAQCWPSDFVVSIQCLAAVVASGYVSVSNQCDGDEGYGVLTCVAERVAPSCHQEVDDCLLRFMFGSLVGDEVVVDLELVVESVLMSVASKIYLVGSVNTSSSRHIFVREHSLCHCTSDDQRACTY